ncbi:MAG: hypothetical protein K6F80_06270 [Oscillospiraceae bacterium]|nr:hypothetical protein [Oscillospiraceae bacterium]
MKKVLLTALLMSTLLATGCYDDYYFEDSAETTTITTESLPETADTVIAAGDISTEGETDFYEMEDSSDMVFPPEDAPEQVWTEETVWETNAAEETMLTHESETEETTADSTPETTVTDTSTEPTETTTSAEPTAPAETEQIIETETTTEGVTEPITEPLKSDYDKALEVYEYMLANGHGTCVNYACQTFEKCQEIGLPCYIVWTDAQLYAHVANTVQVDGIWFILDTQGQMFLTYNYGFTEVIDMEMHHIGDADMLSDYRYDELFG